MPTLYHIVDQARLDAGAVILPTGAQLSDRAHQLAQLCRDQGLDYVAIPLSEPVTALGFDGASAELIGGQMFLTCDDEFWIEGHINADGGSGSVTIDPLHLRYLHLAICDRQDEEDHAYAVHDSMIPMLRRLGIKGEISALNG
jgi:hypothetical protein